MVELPAEVVVEADELAARVGRIRGVKEARAGVLEERLELYENIDPRLVLGCAGGLVGGWSISVSDQAHTVGTRKP
ncbi:MAG: hypothetical protein JRN21_04100 [Nitrososphaerota archaeon]|nr:hypothetical protein [Nitrososphaerota archaeon]